MEASEPGFGAYSGDRYDYRLFQLLIRSPYRAKYATMFLIIFFMEKISFRGSIEALCPASGAYPAVL